MLGHIAIYSMGQGTTVKISADRDKILIGEPIRLVLEADIPENEAIRFFQIDSLPHFEFLELAKIDTTNTGNGTVLTQTMVITSFDSGHWVIPAFVLGGKLATDSLPIDVGYSQYDPKQPYHDVKDIIEVSPVEEKKTNWWYYIAAGAVVLLVLIYLLTRKKKIAIKAVAPVVDPYAAAMQRLEALVKQKKETKLYYSGLVDVFRMYIHERKGLHSMQKTTDDLVVQLKGLALPATQFEQLSHALRLSDYVKFAKYIPADTDDGLVFDAIKNAIVTIEKTNVAVSSPPVN